MKELKSNIAVGAVILVALLAAARTAYYIQLDNDGMRYGLVADQILLGRGLRKPVMFNDLHFATPLDSFGTVPYTTQQPLLPVLYALMDGVRPGRLWPGQILNVCAHVLISLFSFMIARRLAGTVAGVASGIIVALSYPLLRVVGHLWTEALFIALVMVTIKLLQASRMRSPGWGYLLGSSAAAAAAFATRSIGVALVPLFLWEAVVAWRRGGLRPAIRTLLITVPVPLIVIAALWSRNFLLTGTIRGDWLPDTGRSWIVGLTGFMGVTVNQFGVYGLCLRAALSAILFGIPCTALLFLPKGKTEISNLWREGLDLVLLAAICYIVVIAHSLAGSQAVFEIRFAAPLVPLIIITAVVVVVRGWNILGEIRLRRLTSFCLLGSLLLIGTGEAVRSFKLLPKDAETLFWYRESYWCKWMVSHCEPGSIIVTNVPCRVPFFSGIAALRPPYRGHNPFKRIPHNMDEILPRKMKEIGAKYILLVDVWNGLPEEHWGEFMAALSRREPISDRFTIVQEWPGSVVYELKE